MPNSPNSSRTSVRCHLEWRPSRLLAAALCGLGVLAAMALLSCELPLAGALPAAVVAPIAAAWLARRELARPAVALAIAAAPGASIVDGRPVSDLSLQWRGHLAFLSFRDADGVWQRLAWWPDTLDAATRRELRLAVAVQATAQPASSMAP